MVGAEEVKQEEEVESPTRYMLPDFPSVVWQPRDVSPRGTGFRGEKRKKKQKKKQPPQKKKKTAKRKLEQELAEGKQQTLDKCLNKKRVRFRIHVDFNCLYKHSKVSKDC